MVRIAIPIWLLTAPLASAQETTVWLTILGRGGAEEVDIGPDGGLVPYRLTAQTDPIGTPGNHGLWSVSITIDTDTGVEQQPVAMLDPTVDVLFVSVWPSVNRYGPGVSKGRPVTRTTSGESESDLSAPVTVVVRACAGDLPARGKPDRSPSPEDT